MQYEYKHRTYEHDASDNRKHVERDWQRGDAASEMNQLHKFGDAGGMDEHAFPP